MAINAVWHRAHRMPTNATLEEKIVWHTSHAKHCTCRDSAVHLRTLRAQRNNKTIAV